MDYRGESEWIDIANKHWIGKTTKPRTDWIKSELWDTLERENFELRSLVLLENLQLLEKCLWPTYDDNASNYHVLLLALMVTVKRKEGLPVWNIFATAPANFSALFRRVLSLSLDDSVSTPLRTHLLSFLIAAFQSLDHGIVRKECAPLVSISVWHNLVSEKVRENKLDQHGQLRKAWRASNKRYEAADEITKARLRFERSWLFSSTMDFVNRLYKGQDSNADNIMYCEKYIEFLTDLESQLPTRRYVNQLLLDLNLLALIKHSPAYNDDENGLLRDLFSLLRHFINFPINDHTGAQHSHAQVNDIHYESLARLQRVSLQHFKSKLTIFALANYGAIEKCSDLQGHLAVLSTAELVELCSSLGMRTAYPPLPSLIVDRLLLMEIILTVHEKRKTFEESVKDLNVLPTEVDLYEPSLLRNESYSGSRSLAIPKLNLQYLTIGDFLWRSFILYRCESFFEIRKDMEDIIKRLQPRYVGTRQSVQFDGFSRMALPISRPSVLEVSPPKVGFDQPASVKAEISLDQSSLAENIRREWDSLRPDDVIYLLAARPHDDPSLLTNGHSSHTIPSDLIFLRTAEVVQLLDENGRTLRDASNEQVNGHNHRPRLRRLVVNIDAAAYKEDEARKAQGKPDIYDSINVIVRRKGRENNFKQILQSIQSLTLSDVPVPSWLQEVFLGYGDPAGATYGQLPNRIQKIDFRDTFLDWEHLLDVFPGKSVEPSDGKKSPLRPPYVLETFSSENSIEARPSKKRRRDENKVTPSPAPVVKVSTYIPPETGPYFVDSPKINKVRFTRAQVDAILSGTQPGLTVIVGPPGTGKTDVATQIINNIYHDFPSQRTLLITHSNQALNQLFQKITKLDIDERHLLRLGHGEEDLETGVSYSKYGRVESFLDNRVHYLAEVDRLASSLGAPGAHGSSCETAGYFHSVYISPAWSKFWDSIQDPNVSVDEMISFFPFHIYFESAPQPLMPPEASKERLIAIARGCQYHIEKIFKELEDIRPFEILRNSRDKANYLLIKEARIIAMTSTHAAMRRQEIASLGFHYDNVVMEEAAQITEVENYIPLALQDPKDGELPLQRIVLCGDHLQNSPIIQNLAFRQYANLEQSLFLRLVRLGVPVITLDQQGRCRPSIAELYKWRYQNLGNLPNVLNSPEYSTGNAGFRYDFQFINVPEYRGVGETQPSPHFIQNLGEAEYAVAIYQYMRLLGYPASKISILTTYAGQRSLIRDVLGHRCKDNRLFGLPKIVTTVDKYQGEQNDYIILSLVRTTRVGYLRDIRRLTVALSRARLGLYILGRREVFESCYELREAFDRLLKHPTDSLALVPGELFPTVRKLQDEVAATEMTGVEHLGQYVYEMTQAKIAQLKGSVVPVVTRLSNGEEKTIGQGKIEEEEEEEEEEELEGPLQPQELEI